MQEARVTERDRFPRARIGSEIQFDADERSERSFSRFLFRVPRERELFPGRVEFESFGGDPLAECFARESDITAHPIVRELLRPVARIEGFGRAVCNREAAVLLVAADRVFTLRRLKARFGQQHLLYLQFPDRALSGRTHSGSVISSIQRYGVMPVRLGPSS